MSLPDQITESSSDDVQSVDFNLDDIVKQFIDPIERKRSHAAPSLLQPIYIKQQNVATGFKNNDLNNANVDTTAAQESRAHAFYRMLGFPVMDQHGDIYNPGFNPHNTMSDLVRYATIANNVPKDIIAVQRARELSVRENNNLFQKSLTDSSVFAIVQLLPKKFQVIDKNKTFDQMDPQFKTIKAREELTKQYQLSDGTEISKSFSDYYHVLRPFLVNPVIERTTQSVGRKSRICQPFLPDKQSTNLENDTYLDRPGIEFILRLRLKEQKFQEALMQTAAEISSQTVASVQDTITLPLSQLKTVVSALLDKNNVNNTDINNLFQKGYNSFEITNINKLVRLINAAIESFGKAIETLYKVNSVLDWTPLPGKYGLEYADKLELGTVIQKKQLSSELDRNILILKLKSELAKTRGVSSDDDIGSYSIEFFENTEARFTNELNDLEHERLTWIKRGANSLRTIEVIAGEQSGLGLIDILAIYTALWAVDLDVLIGLLDNQAFQRLVDNNPDLINNNVQLRIINGNAPVISHKDSIKKFEEQVINILDFADKRLKEVQSSPDTVDGGLIPQGG